MHWSSEIRFFSVTEGRIRVWRHGYATYTPRNISLSVPFGEGVVMMWGFPSHDCKLDMVVMHGDRYMRQVMIRSLYNILITTSARPVYMDDNARPYCSRQGVSQAQLHHDRPFARHEDRSEPVGHRYRI